jgi:hypothetical protein
VVNGPFPSGSVGNGPGGVTGGPVATGLPSTVSTDVATDTVPNQAAHKVDSICHSTQDSVFSGGYTLSHALFADVPGASVRDPPTGRNVLGVGAKLKRSFAGGP